MLNWQWGMLVFDLLASDQGPCVFPSFHGFLHLRTQHTSKNCCLLSSCWPILKFYWQHKDNSAAQRNNYYELFTPLSPESPHIFEQLPHIRELLGTAQLPWATSLHIYDKDAQQSQWAIALFYKGNVIV